MKQNKKTGEVSLIWTNDLEYNKLASISKRYALPGVILKSRLGSQYEQLVKDELNVKNIYYETERQANQAV